MDMSILPPATEGGLNRGVLASNDELMAICRAFLDKMRSGTAPWVVQRLNHTYGPEPVDDPSNFSFWMALVRGVSPRFPLFSFQEITHFCPLLLGRTLTTGPAYRRERKGKTSPDSFAAPTAASRRALDRTVKQHLVRTQPSVPRLQYRVHVWGTQVVF